MTRRWSRQYQVYYRSPVTRKFVAVDRLVVKLDKAMKEPELRNGIPALSYRGNPIWVRDFS